MRQALVILMLAAFGSAHPSPGTETILLVKGGYGPGLNLISGGMKTERMSHRPTKAKVDRTEKEEQEFTNLDGAIHNVVSLQQQLQEVAKESSMAMQQSEDTRIDRAELQDKLAEQSKKLQRAEESNKQNVQLQTQADKLRSQIAAEKVNTAAEHQRAQAYDAKVQSLEQDITMLSKAWRSAAQHQARLAKAATPQQATKPKSAEQHNAPVKAAKKVQGPKVIHLKAATKVAAPKAATKVAAPAAKKSQDEDAIADQELEDDNDSDADSDTDANAVADSAPTASDDSTAEASNQEEETSNDDDGDSDDADGAGVW